MNILVCVYSTDCVLRYLSIYLGVLEAAVIGLPHETLGEEVGVAIHPRPGHSVDLASLRDVCSKLAKFKQPVAVFLWENEQLPRKYAARSSIVVNNLLDNVLCLT